MTLEFRPLKVEDVEVRVAQVGKKAVGLLLYKDARCDMRMLDEVVGPENWQCEYTEIGGKLFCTVSIMVGKDKDGWERWVSKQDVGVPSNMEATKGEASDAFKRACFKWGIGRELYTAPDIWVERNKCKNIRQGKNGREQCYDKFVVTDMDVDEGRIVNLTICNRSDKMSVVYGVAPKRDRFARLKELKEEALSLGITEDGVHGAVGNVLDGGKVSEGMADGKLRECEKAVETLIADKRTLDGGM